MRRIWFSLLLLTLFALPVSAQNRPAWSAAANAVPVAFGQSIAALNGPWKFHVGDNPQWADPNFDDSHWETVDLTPKAGSYDPIFGYSGYVPGWTDKGHPGYWGYAWYRIRVRVVVQRGQRLALLGSADVDDVYQVFANGKLLGSFGKFPPPGSSSRQTPVVYYTQPAIFLWPQSWAGDNSGFSVAPATQVLAFRVWMQPISLHLPHAGGLHIAPFLGEAGAVALRYQQSWFAVGRAYASYALLAALFLLLALLACSLIFFDRSDPVYGWLAAVFLLTAIRNACSVVGGWTQVASASTVDVTIALLEGLVLGGWVMVWWVWFRLRRPTWTPRAIVVLTVLYMVSLVLGENFFLWVPNSVGAPSHLAAYVFFWLLLLLLALIVIGGTRKLGREGWLAVPAILLLGVGYLPFAWLAGLGVRQLWFPFGTQFAVGAISDIAFAATMVLLLLRRLMLSLRHQREMALDVKQAQQVQQVLIPQELPRVPGLTIESEYRPAREVGGDFFQILPNPADGSVLIVAGDVTGKGLQAGMLVALIVGATRSTAETSSDPLEVIEALNRRLCGRGHAHATCLALRIASNGEVMLANAGHLPPYLNGKELPMEGALPLGLIERAEFSVMHFELRPDDTLLLLSDGVAEAQNKEGQLFGFDRIRALLEKPISAAQVAAAAQNFGQQDDISVLRIVRKASIVEPTAEEAALAIG